MPPHRHAYRPAVMGTRGAVASAHPLASMAGIRVLLEGGNAVDAAVAVGSTLNVVEPFMSGAGGIGLMLISRAHGRRAPRAGLHRPRAARRPTRARATEDELAGGPKSCATPGNLGGWLAALERFGTMPRSRVLGARHRARRERRAADLDERPASSSQARATLARSAEAQRLYLGNGGPRAGQVVTYKELAATFRQVAEGGAEVFYRGPDRAGHRADGASRRAAGSPRPTSRHSRRNGESLCRSPTATTRSARCRRPSRPSRCSRR